MILHMCYDHSFMSKTILLHCSVAAFTILQVCMHTSVIMADNIQTLNIFHISIYFFKLNICAPHVVGQNEQLYAHSNIL